MSKLSYIAIGAGLNFAGLFVAGKVIGIAGLASSGFAAIVAIVLALIATSALHYFLTYSHLRQQVEDEFDDDLDKALLEEVEQDQPRRFTETNFK